jgi:HAMP domain-containing protein/CHASE3 domain sensor protein
VQTRRKADDPIASSPQARAGDPERRSRPAHGPGPHDTGGRRLGLHNWRVRSKLTAVLVIPAVAFLVVASFAIGSTVRDARSFDSGRRLAELGRQVTALVHEVQSERDLTAGYIETGRTQRVGDLPGQRQRVDRLAAAYRTAEAPLYDEFGSRLATRFGDVRARLDDVVSLREGIDSGSLTERAVFNEYSAMVAALLEVDREIAQPSGDEELTQTVRAFNDLSRAKEATAQVRGTLYSILLRQGFAFGEFQELADLLAQQRAAFDQFQADANEQQRSLYTNGLKGQAVLAAQRIQDAALNRQANPDLQLDPEQWYAATSTQIELIRGDEARLLDDVVAQSRSLSADAQRRSAVDVLLLAVILAVALLALAVVARSMARPLQHLRAAALDIADHRLPKAVEQLRTAETGSLDVKVEPIGIRSRDEIGQVAQAVNAIQQVAIRVATEQAALRRSIGDMFTNLARRSQTLIDRQLELIDDLERSEADPETLKHLFRLDHLATRMRRNAEDLIVLSGADPGRTWAQSMTLVDVVRAATAEVEEYQRIELLPLADVEVAGHATIDVIHLLAELIENATSFSPPSTQVQIAGQAVGHGYVIEIEDRGLGMSDQELVEANERLANPPEIDFALSRVLGLYVVGRLAQRNGIMVQLRRSWYGGVTALAMLPYPLLLWPGGAPTMARPPQSTHVRPALPAPRRVTMTPGPASSLPIFEATRSDWFMAEREELPNAHRQEDQPEAGPEPEAGPGAGAPALAETSSTPPDATDAIDTPDATTLLTEAGLPRRMPRANLAPGAAEQPDDQPRATPTKSPEELRETLSSYHSGLEHGRLAADGLETGQTVDEAP